MALDEPQKDDKSNEVNGIKLLMDNEVLGYVEGNTIEFITGPNEGGFTISNSSSCC